MNNWLRYALYSFLGILLLVAIMGLLAPDNPYGNMAGMQMQQMGPMSGGMQARQGNDMRMNAGMMNMGNMPPRGAYPASGMAGMQMQPMQPMGNMGASMPQMAPMQGASYPQGAIPMNGVIVMPLPNGGVAVMPMNNMGQMPQAAGMGMVPMSNTGQMPQGGGMGMMPMGNTGQMPSGSGMTQMPSSGGSSSGGGGMGMM